MRMHNNVVRDRERDASEREREEASGESTGRPITGLGHDAPLAFAALSQLTWHVQVLG